MCSMKYSPEGPTKLSQRGLDGRSRANGMLRPSRKMGRLLLLAGWWVATRAEANAPPAGAVDAVVFEVTQSLGKAPAGSVVIASPLTSEATTRKGYDLALRIATLVAGRICDGAHAPLQTAS